MKIIIPLPSPAPSPSPIGVMSIISTTVPRAELYVCQSSDAAITSGVPAQRVEVVAIVEVQRRFVAQAAPDGVGIGVDLLVVRVVVDVTHWRGLAART